MRRTSSFITIILVCLAGVSCEQVKSYNPLSPNLAGPIPWVQIEAPKLLEPFSGQRFRPTEQPIRLLIENATSNGPRPLFYTFEIASDSGFANVMFRRERVSPGEGGRTTLILDGKLQEGRNYYWRSRAADGANTGPFSSTRSFEVEEPVVLQAPIALLPKGGLGIATLQPTLTVANAGRTGPHGVLFYQFEVALDQAFAARIYDGDTLEGPGNTSVTMPMNLPVSTLLFWRVRVNDGQYVSPWSSVESFRTPAAPAAPGPPPPSAPPPSTACNTLSAPLQILECLRPSYPSGQLHGSHAVNFLTAAAIEFNRAGVNGGGFGILVKTGGNNCNGYSCDILCQGQGSGQKQYDVLVDETYPTWGPPLPVIRVDVCHVK